jgi:hypothetical protein
MAPIMERREAFENLLDTAKNGGFGANQELGSGRYDPMCLDQHVHLRMLRDGVQGATATSREEAHALELLPQEVTALRNLHNAETRYRCQMAETTGNRAAKLRDFPEILERICAGEKVEVAGREIDVNLDFAKQVEMELKEARKKAKRVPQHPAARGRQYRHRSLTGSMLQEAYNACIGGFNDAIAEQVFMSNPMYNWHRNQAENRQRQQNEETLRRVIAVDRDITSGDFLWRNDRGEVVHRISEAEARDGSRQSEVRMHIMPEAGPVQWFREEDPIPATLMSPLTLSVGIR